MRVEDGRVTTTADGETEIAKCRWMATNSYTDLDPAFKRAYPVDIESVKAYGPPSALAPLTKRVMVHGAAIIHRNTINTYNNLQCTCSSRQWGRTLLASW